MRYAIVAFCLFASANVYGQSAPYLVTVNSSDAALVAGPSKAFPVTSTLKPGDALIVDHEEANGWLAIAPGNPYSLSWVPAQFLGQFDPTKRAPFNVTVEEDTTLSPGQMGMSTPLSKYRRTSVPQGTILTVIGAKVTVNDGAKSVTWYPVLPPAGDFRYISKDLVRGGTTVNTSFTVRDGASTAPIPPGVVTPVVATIPSPPVPTVPVIAGPPGMPVGSVPPAPPAPAVQSAAPAAQAAPVVNNPLWAQAEAAEQQCRLDDAEKLYFQLARQMNEPGGDHDIANLCYTRIHSIREKKRAMQPTPPGGATRTPLGAPTQPISSTTTTTAAGGQTTTADGVSGLAASGKLRNSALWVDGQKTYVIESSPGVPVVYAVAAPGIDLVRYLNKRIDVYGSSTTRRDCSKPLVVVTRVELLPDK